MLIDEAEIEVSSGKGGDGIVHFRREKYVPRGGPDGGDGGKGGDVILKVNPHLNTLINFRYQKKFSADPGGKGGGSNQTGRSAEPLVILVPPGTLVYDAENDELLGDLTENHQELVVCFGGRAGRGNARFANSRNQAPRIAEKGEPGQEKRLRLELKLIADIGIIGAPNAGKSTFLAAVSQAKPKIAAYPFTTIEPNLGVAELPGEITLVLADIPGLIEGAHRGVGLGHEFLRHIQRTRVLIHLLDGMSEDPILDFAQINTELALFDPDLAKKPQIVAFNKMDLSEVKQRWQELQNAFGKKDIVCFPISAASGEGVRDVLWQAHRELEDAPKPVDQEIAVYRVDSDPRVFDIIREQQAWRVKGEAIERAASMTYWEYDQSVRRFQKVLKSLGVEDALRAAGVQEGDTVRIADFELEWQD